MKTQYGFVALIDALGTKTDSIESSIKYLKSVDKIKNDIEFAHKATKSSKNKESKEKLFDNLNIRFFGDTLLLTYAVEDKSMELEYFNDLCFILNGFICTALEMGLLFRGSLSLGEYMAEGDVVLGPAVFDAAAWYDKLEMIGVVATPQATISIKHIYHKNRMRSSWLDGVFGFYPLKNSLKVELLALNWTRHLKYGLGKNESVELHFYKCLRSCSVPFGTELKFQNTEKFFLDQFNSEDWQALEEAITEGEKSKS